MASFRWVIAVSTAACGLPSFRMKSTCHSGVDPGWTLDEPTVILRLAMVRV